MARTTRARLGVGSAKTGDAASRARALELAKRNVSELTSLGRRDAPKAILVYGETGIGKTTFLSQIPGVVVLPVERGANEKRVSQWTKPLDSMDDVDEALDTLRYAPHDYRAAAIETLDGLESLMRERIETKLAEEAAGRRSKGDKPPPTTLAEWNEAEFGAGYDALLDEWRSLFARLDALREERGMTVALSAHAKVETVPTLDVVSDFKRYTILVSGKKCAEAIKAWVDFLVFLKADVFLSKEGSREKVLAKSAGRYLYLTQQATHDAKARGSIVYPDRLPLEPGVGWTTFERLIRFDATHTEALEAIARRLPPERTTALVGKFDELFKGKQYDLCMELLSVAEEEARRSEARDPT